MRALLLVLGGVLGVLAFGPLTAQDGRQSQAQPPMSEGDVERTADREAIEQSARDFSKAYNQGDAKAIAAMYTANAESRDFSGRTFIGRSVIEKAYTDLFQAGTGSKIEVLVQSIRFPAKDLAIEEGLLRQTRGPKDLPSSISYVAVHVREGGQWKIALSSEGMPGQQRLEDLEWLLGDWTTRVKDNDIKLSFVRDLKKAVITATFTRTAPSKEPVTGTIRIAVDPETRQIRSWGFEDDGAHSQALWVCDGKSWILDARGVLADGTPTAERIVLQRVNPDVITWRAIDRLVDDVHLPDTLPMRLIRSAPSK